MLALRTAAEAGGLAALHRAKLDDDAPAAGAVEEGTKATGLTQREPGRTLAELAAQKTRPTSAASAAVPAPPPERPSDLQMAQMANDVYTLPDARTGKTGTASEADLAKAGWQRAGGADLDRLGINGRDLNDPDSGLQAAIYKKDGQYVVAFAGTQDAADWMADASQGLGLKTAQYDQAAKLAQTMAYRVGSSNVSFTGHSLGGGLAQTATVAGNSYGVSFNAAGVDDATIARLGLDPKATRKTFSSPDRIRAHAVDGDPLTTVNGSTVRAPLFGPRAPWVPVVTLPKTLGHDYALPARGRMDPLALHGGGGNGQIYVDDLKRGQAEDRKAASASAHEAREIGRRVIDAAKEVLDSVNPFK